MSKSQNIFLQKNVNVCTNGITLHTVQAGDENHPLVILLHGFPEHWRAWESEMEGLATAGYWVWAPDQRGYNLSEIPRTIAAYGLDVLAADLLGLIDAAGREKAILIGHDWGASVAWWVAIQLPHRVQALVALNGAHVKVAREYRRKNLRQILKSWYALPFLFPGLPEWYLKRNGWKALIRQLQKSGHPMVQDPAKLEQYQAAWSISGAFTGMVNWYRAAFWDKPAFKGTLKLKVPVLILWGAKDIYIHRALATQSRDRCSDCKLLFFEENGHWLHHEAPDQVHAEIVQFLSGIAER